MIIILFERQPIRGLRGMAFLDRDVPRGLCRCPGYFPLLILNSAPKYAIIG